MKTAEETIKQIYDTCRLHQRGDITLEDCIANSTLILQSYAKEHAIECLEANHQHINKDSSHAFIEGVYFGWKLANQ